MFRRLTAAGIRSPTWKEVVDLLSCWRTVRWATIVHGQLSSMLSNDGGPFEDPGIPAAAKAAELIRRGGVYGGLQYFIDFAGGAGDDPGCWACASAPAGCS
jgi:hypothetical protein